MFRIFSKLHSKHPFLKSYHKKCYRLFCTSHLTRNVKKLELDYEFLCNPKNQEFVENVISLKKSKANLGKVINLYETYQHTINQNSQIDINEKQNIYKELEKEALLIPNMVSPTTFDIGEEPKIIEIVNEKPSFTFEPKMVTELGEDLNIYAGKRVQAPVAAKKSQTYYFRDSLAVLEQALIR